MTGRAQRTEWALQQFDGFVESCVGPGLMPYLREEISHVHNAIRAIAPPTDHQPIGYAVYGLRPETRDRRRESGFDAVVVSAVFDEPPTAITDDIHTRTYWSNPDHRGLSDFGICRLQQIST